MSTQEAPRNFIDQFSNEELGELNFKLDSVFNKKSKDTLEDLNPKLDKLMIDQGINLGYVSVKVNAGNYYIPTLGLNFSDRYNKLINVMAKRGSLDYALAPKEDNALSMAGVKEQIDELNAQKIAIPNLTSDQDRASVITNAEVDIMNSIAEAEGILEGKKQLKDKELEMLAEIDNRIANITEQLNQKVYGSQPAPIPTQDLTQNAQPQEPHEPKVQDIDLNLSEPEELEIPEEVEIFNDEMSDIEIIPEECSNANFELISKENLNPDLELISKEKEEYVKIIDDTNDDLSQPKEATQVAQNEDDMYEDFELKPDDDIEDNLLGKGLEESDTYSLSTIKYKSSNKDITI